MLVLQENDIIIYNKNSTVRIIEGNIMYVRYKNNSIIEIEDVIELEKAYNSLKDPKPMKVLSEMGEYASISTEARAFAAERSPDLTAIAYVINGLAQRLLIKFYIRMWKRNKPYKVFDSLDDGLEWLNKM